MSVQSATLESFVWDDQNGNGKQDESEHASDSVQIDLLKPGGKRTDLLNT